MKQKIKLFLREVTSVRRPPSHTIPRHFSAFIFLASAAAVYGADGFATVNGNTTGGAGGPVVTVTNGTDFITQATMNGPRIIQVQGPITIGSVSVKSDKSILGIDTNATLLGRLSISGVSNVIVQNLRITNPGNDGISVRDPNTHHVWVDHCTFYDCGDGSCDISQSADYVTVSWCKFIYPTQTAHRFTMIGDGVTAAGIAGRITLHHNWWGYRCDQRMPASSYATIHVYNNYFNCTNNSYCSNARTDTEMNAENNFYSGVKDPIGISSGTNGKIKTSGNIYAGCTGTIHPGTDTVFSPPYAYTLDATVDVPALVTAGAGAPGPNTVPIPPKVWDGGGANNNLTTADNWGLNENPKEYDILAFAGSTRLAPNNNFSSGNEFPGLVFSNNAGAFVIGGNQINIGGFITDNSSATQTLNLNVSFGYGTEHYTNARAITVGAAAGSLIINGIISGPSSTFVDKYGSGTLVLAGANTFTGQFTVKAGKVLVNNTTGSGTGTASVTVNSGAILGGTGTIGTNVVNNGLLSPGNSIGTLTVSGNLTSAGTLLMELNRTNGLQTNDLIAVAGSFTTSSGALVVTNIGPALVAGDFFQLFSSGRTFASVNLQTNDLANNVTYVWNNTLASNGRITVQSVSPIVNPNPTNITATITGGALQISWPEDHIGWRLESQTNAADIGLSTNWATVEDSATTNQMSVPIDPAHGSVFFRLAYP